MKKTDVITQHKYDVIHIQNNVKKIVIAVQHQNISVWPGRINVAN